MDSSRLLTTSLRELPWGAQVAEVMAHAVAAVEPAAAVRRFLRHEHDQLWVHERCYDLSTYRRVLLVGVGKAGVPMTQAAAAIISDRLAAGVVVAKELSHDISIPRVQLFEAGHPLPDGRGVAAAQEIAALLQDAGEDDLVVALISGGGSALLPLPVAGVDLQQLQALTSMLLACGATINEINTLRKHLEQLKGGGFARMAAPATLATLVLSDVVGNPLDVIASGPTVPDSSSFADAYSVLERHGLLTQAPTPIRTYLEAGVRGDVSDTPNLGDALFERVQNVIIGSNEQAAEAAIASAQQFGFHTLLLSTYIQGEAREVGRVLAAIARQLHANNQPLPRPACIVLGGETTVTLRGNGRGGRNQELALATVIDLAGLHDIVLVSLATDGGDGPTDAAGAVVTGKSLERAQAQGLDPHAYLARNDAYTFFDALGDLLKTEPTATNVNDLAFLFVR